MEHFLIDEGYKLDLETGICSFDGRKLYVKGDAGNLDGRCYQDTIYLFDFNKEIRQ